MIINTDDKIAKNIEVLDLDTGKFLKRVLKVDFETMEYLQYSDSLYLNVWKVGNIVCVYKG